MPQDAPFDRDTFDEIEATVDGGDGIDVSELADLPEDKRDDIMDILEGAEDHTENLPDPDDVPDAESDDTDGPEDTHEKNDTQDTGAADDIPDETKTLSETGLLDEEDNFPWEGESLGETDVGESGVIERFRYKQTQFEVSEPEDRQRFEDNFETLQGVQEIDDKAKRRATSDRYSRKVSEQCLTVEGHPIASVYRVEHDGSAYVVPDEHGEKGLAGHSDAQQLWDAMTWFDRFKIGMRIGEDVLGERQFRSTFG